MKWALLEAEMRRLRPLTERGGDGEHISQMEILKELWGGWLSLETVLKELEEEKEESWQHRKRIQSASESKSRMRSSFAQWNSDDEDNSWDEEDEYDDYNDLIMMEKWLKKLAGWDAQMDRARLDKLIDELLTRVDAGDVEEEDVMRLELLVALLEGRHSWKEEQKLLDRDLAELRRRRHELLSPMVEEWELEELVRIELDFLLNNLRNRRKLQSCGVDLVRLEKNLTALEQPRRALLARRDLLARLAADEVRQ